jgi:putative transposase
LNSTSLSKAYKSERDVHIKEKLLLIIRISFDKQPVELVSQELHRARSWAYKWYRRYNDEGLEGLRDRTRSGKPSSISKDVKKKNNT